MQAQSNYASYLPNKPIVSSLSDILVPANPGPLGKMAVKMDRENFIIITYKTKLSGH